jgi:hypothetical protein
LIPLRFGEFDAAVRGHAMNERFERNPGFFRDLVAFLAENKKWYLIPIVCAIILLGLLIMLGGTAAAPFIYTLF